MKPQLERIRLTKLIVDCAGGFMNRASWKTAAYDVAYDGLRSIVRAYGAASVEII